jgi:hypothetical protein
MHRERGLTLWTPLLPTHIRLAQTLGKAELDGYFNLLIVSGVLDHVYQQTVFVLAI